MNVIGINGSPRKKWNTATLVDKALEGAASLGLQRNSFIFMILTLKDVKAALPAKHEVGAVTGNAW